MISRFHYMKMIMM